MLTNSPSDPIAVVAKSLGIDTQRVSQAVRLLSDGNTVPFIARYRKEATGGLDEVQLRSIAEQHAYSVELAERRQTVLRTIDEQGKLDPKLRERIESCTSKTELEDLYAPYRPKRRTRATTARERGLEPLADLIAAQSPSGDPEVEAKIYVDSEKGVTDVAAALHGARDIIAERIADDPELRNLLRTEILALGLLTAVAHGEQKKPTKFDEYIGSKDPVQKIASHRYLALRRGERQKVLVLQIELYNTAVLGRILSHVRYDATSPWAGQLQRAIEDSYQRLLFPSVSSNVHADLKTRADQTALDVFAKNLAGILLAPPLGAQPVLGIDPGLRTGCKCAAVDATGKLLEHTTILPFRDEASKAAAAEALVELTRRVKPMAVAIGNGTAGRETEVLARNALRQAAINDVIVVPVSETGASVYSASDLARAELPDVDVTIRGAVSIARRLQDPLAELVKVEPRSIGVGQYQHDIHQPLLKRKLNEVVESCVNRVGVEVTTASAELLSHVAGIGPKLARNIVAHREQHGGIASRSALREIAGVGERTFEQAAGFLRVRSSANPLDASAVHPERYALVEKMAQDLGVAVGDLIGNQDNLARVEISRYVDGDVGEPTLRDILDELMKPGRDPRDTFEAPRFREDVNTLEDLKVGMELEGVITNVTAFGAFVDVGVHQDGLVHVSQLAQRFVSDPSEVVKVGSRITVRVLAVDLERRRISLTARKPQAAPKVIRRERSGVGRPVESRSVEGRPAEGSVEGRSVEGRSVEGRSVEGRSGEGRSGEGRSGDGRSGDGRSGDGRSGDGRSGDGRMRRDRRSEATDDRPGRIQRPAGRRSPGASATRASEPRPRRDTSRSDLRETDQARRGAQAGDPNRGNAKERNEQVSAPTDVFRNNPFEVLRKRASS